MVDIDKNELDKMMKEAAKAGAEQALADMGISQENIYEMKEAMQIFRAIKKGIFNAISKLIMILVVGTVAAAAGYFGFGIGK